MSIEKIRELRDVQQFTPWDKWDNTINTNCIAYALGLMVDGPNGYGNVFNDLICKGDETIDTLKEVFKALGFQYRRIESESELESGEYGIVLYHYYYKALVGMREFRYYDTCEETHLARIELDRTWTHKFGWDYPTSQTTPEEIRRIILEDDNVDVEPTAMFAVWKP